MKRILVDSGEYGTRIGVVEDGLLAELVYERKNSMPIVGNIYMGKVVNVLPGMQAAFVDIGEDKNAFLYYGDNKDEKGNIIKPKNGSEILVQVEKAGVGKKGSVLTRKISFPGKFIVIIPNDNKIGISKKITDQNERQRIKDVVRGELPESYGVIIRTDGEGKSEETYKKEIERLVKRSEDIMKRAGYAKAPALLYTDANGVAKVVRDFFHSDIDEIVAHSEDDYEELLKLCREIGEDESKIRLHNDGTPLFGAYYVEGQAKAAFNKQVWLKSGGFIIIEQTEACVVIDVNTGKYTGKVNLEKTIL